jgi:hypothetical protein
VILFLAACLVPLAAAVVPQSDDSRHVLAGAPRLCAGRGGPGARDLGESSSADDRVFVSLGKSSEEA